MFLYHGDSRIALEFMGQLYYYLYNLQGDVVGLVDKTGTTMVTYTYDVWGKPESTTGPMATTLGVANPFRYRGYYYDTESGFYYLQSRYYDPEVGRFLNADGVLGANQDILSYNLYSYCSNNPVNMSDPTGMCPYNGTIADFHRMEQGLPPMDCNCWYLKYLVIVGNNPPVQTPAQMPETETENNQFIEELLNNALTGVGDSITGKVIADHVKTNTKYIPKRAGYAFNESVGIKVIQSRPATLGKAVNGFSKTAGVVSAAAYMWDIGCDFQHYGGFTRDFGIAAGITTGGAALSIGVGGAFSLLGGPAVVGFIGCVAVGSLIGIGCDYLKKEIIGY